VIVVLSGRGTPWPTRDQAAVSSQASSGQGRATVRIATRWDRPVQTGLKWFTSGDPGSAAARQANPATVVACVILLVLGWVYLTAAAMAEPVRSALMMSAAGAGALTRTGRPRHHEPRQVAPLFFLRFAHAVAIPGRPRL
jgi:hypothetical protein